MKKWFFFLMVIELISGCRKNEETTHSSQKAKIQDGIYMGYFEYQKQNYWCEIAFENNQYVEWPSGGAMYQKSYSCLTVGTYSVSGYKLVFNLGSYKMPGFPENCVREMFLPGEYTIFGTMKADSIIFEKGSGSGKIKYHLIKFKPD